MSNLREVSRSYSEIVQELQEIKKESRDRKVGIMIDALIWGYTSSRTTFNLESRLYRLNDISVMVHNLAESWDGNDFLSGALKVANSNFEDYLE